MVESPCRSAVEKKKQSQMVHCRKSTSLAERTASEALLEMEEYNYNMEEMDQAAKSGMGLGDALELPAANSQSTVTVLSAPPYGDL